MNLNTFRQNITKPSAKLRYKFLVDSNDYTDLLLDLPAITRNVNLAAGKATVVVNNSGGWWNYLYETNVALGDTAEIQVYIDGDPGNTLTILKGKIQRPKFQGARVALVIRDWSGDFLNVKVGSNRQPATWFLGGNRTPDEMAWRLLTVHGGLSSLASPANTDIDYASFADWRDNYLAAKTYEWEARLTGHTISEVLMRICQQSHSYMWVNNDGKVDFAPPHDPGYSYDESNTSIRDLEVNEDHILNSVEARNGYNDTLGTWARVTTTSTTAASITRFGTFPKTIEDRILWHETTASGESDRDDTLTDYAFPLRFVMLKAGPPAIMEDLGRQLDVSDTLKGWSNIAPLCEEITYDLDKWEVNIKARWPW